MHDNALPIDADLIGAIPAELKALPQWVCWRLEERDGNQTKVPYNAKSGRRARSNDPATWTEFGTAMDAYRRGVYSGVGFMFWEGDGITGLDLDHVIDLATGEIDPRALEIIERFKGSYCEVSPSGTGLRIFTRGSPGRTGKNEGRGKWLEVYTHPSHRYLTVTGHHWQGSAATVTDQQDALDWLYSKYFVKPAASESDPATRQTPDLGMDDAALLLKARNATNGNKFRALFDDGDTSGYGDDDSAADLALCSLLAFWTQKDAGRIDRLFRQSKLMREKWDRADYRQRTIDKAISECRDVYHERRRKRGPGLDPERTDEGAGDGKPTIDANPGDLHIVVRQAEQALLVANVDIFQRVGVLVRPAVLPTEVKVAGTEVAAGSLVIEPVSKAWLAERMNEVATWRKYQI